MEDDESLSMNSLLLNPAPDPAFVSATCFLGLDFFCFFDFSLRGKQQTLTTVALLKVKIIHEILLLMASASSVGPGDSCTSH